MGASGGGAGSRGGRSAAGSTRSSLPCQLIPEAAMNGGIPMDCQQRAPLPVLVTNAHPLFATALRMALRAEGLCAHQLPATTPRAILAAAGLFPAAVVVLDLAWGADTASRSLDRPGLVAALCEQGKHVVLLAGPGDEPIAALVVAAGAVGALTSSTSFEALVCALTKAAAGHPIMTDAEH
jgi:DNA-binding NarL/FixJ family response regulator